jgi:hypothetical protein
MLSGKILVHLRQCINSAAFSTKTSQNMCNKNIILEKEKTVGLFEALMIPVLVYKGPK